MEASQATPPKTTERPEILEREYALAQQAAA